MEASGGCERTRQGTEEPAVERDDIERPDIEAFAEDFPSRWATSASMAACASSAALLLAWSFA